MRKLFTCLYGSNLYGTNTPESDRDIKHIVLPDLEDLLLGHKIVNVVKKAKKEEGVRNGPEDVDEEFIPIQVFARDFLEGQTYALELAFAVEGTGAEQTFYFDGAESLGKEFRFKRFCRELRTKFLTSTMHAMSRYAENQAQLYSNKGERLNAATAVLMLLAKREATYSLGIPEIIADMEEVAALFPECVEITTYDQSGKGNIAPCFRVLGRVLPYTNSVLEGVRTVSSIRDRYGKRAEAASVDNVDWKATMHAYRIINEGIYLLTRRKLTYPYSALYVESLLKIKRGEEPYEDVKTAITFGMEQLKKLEAESTLPCLTPEITAEMETWLVGWLKEFYL